MKLTLFSSPLLRSCIQSENATKSEQILGYFLGPCLAYMMYSGVAGTYLTQFYTDVLGIAGIFLTMMPLISKILSSVICFVLSGKTGLYASQIIQFSKAAAVGKSE